MNLSDSAQEVLGKLLEILHEDGDLRAWFESFENVPAVERRLEFELIADRMRAAGEHPELIQATALLAEDPVYEAVRRTLAEARS